MNISSMSCISFDAGTDDIAQLTAAVTSPSGKEEPCVLKKLPNNRMGEIPIQFISLLNMTKILNAVCILCSSFEQKLSVRLIVC